MQGEAKALIRCGSHSKRSHDATTLFGNAVVLQSTASITHPPASLPTAAIPPSYLSSSFPTTYQARTEQAEGGFEIPMTRLQLGTDRTEGRVWRSGT